MLIRKAAISDIQDIHGILQKYGNDGKLLARPLSQLYDHLRDFFVSVDNSGKIVGSCALQFCWEDIAEIRSLALLKDYQGKGLGMKLVRAAIDEAKTFQIRKIFTLTYQPGFFEKIGFSKIDRSELPVKIWNDCFGCIKFPNCDEIAMLKYLKR